MKECPFCLRPIGNDVIECPHCHNQVDIFRTGYFARPDLSRPKTAIIWVVAIVVVALLAVGLYRGCAVSRRADTSSESRRTRALAERRAGRSAADLALRDRLRRIPGRGAPVSPPAYARRYASDVSSGRSAAL